MDGDIEAVKQHLAAGTDVNAKHWAFGGTPLHQAVIGDHKEIAELLIANGADLNATNNDGDTPLDENPSSQIADLLRKHGGKTSEELIAEGKQPAKAVGAYTNDPHNYLLLLNAGTGSIEDMKQNLADGADLNWDDGQTTPLHYTAIYSRYEAAELLIAKGVNVNAKGVDGETALHFAAYSGLDSKEIAELLIAKGADVNMKNVVGETPLDYADGEIAALLRKHGGKTGGRIES